jgi:hypothetical protein
MVRGGDVRAGAGGAAIAILLARRNCPDANLEELRLATKSLHGAKFYVNSVLICTIFLPHLIYEQYPKQ